MNCQDQFFRRPSDPRVVSRRWFLEQCGIGLGTMALGQLLTEEGYAASPTTPVRGVNPLAPKAPHYAPKAKRVIFLFMAGGPSHLELFDNKPQLAKFDGKLPPAELLKGYRAAFINPDAKLLGPRFQFARHGQSGTELSELLPYMAKAVDDIAVIKSMNTDAFNHAPGQILMSTGSMIFGRPSMGAWVCYGLGSESQDLPGFVVFSTGKKGPSGGRPHDDCNRATRSGSMLEESGERWAIWRCDVPEVSRFFGMVIAMYYNDHTPPHFHVRYGMQKAVVGIDPLALLAGRLSPKTLGLVLEWAALHQAELMANWELARQQAPLNRIDPLE